eukprot:2150395-Ditylum_brightwellii.AAC.1
MMRSGSGSGSGRTSQMVYCCVFVLLFRFRRHSSLGCFFLRLTIGTFIVLFLLGGHTGIVAVVVASATCPSHEFRTVVTL